MTRACVVGWPITHSRSPLIHNHWLRELKIDGEYGREAIAPGGLEDFLRSLADRGYAGCNVTIPHKEAACRLVDDLTHTARAVGAVNTIWREDGRLHGDNTDVEGFLANLDDCAPGWDETTRRALVIGAGGAALGVVHALLSRGVGSVSVANRSVAKAEEIAKRMGPAVSALPLTAANAALASSDLVVNASALGMAGQPPLDLRLDSLKPHAIVSDIVYVPLETPLVAAARRLGLRVAPGLGMLLHQAAPGFARWFGRRPMVTPALRDLVAADVREHSPW